MSAETKIISESCTLVVGKGQWGSTLGDILIAGGENVHFLEKGDELTDDMVQRTNKLIFACGTEGTKERVTQFIEGAQASKKNLSEVILLEIETVKSGVANILQEAVKHGMQVIALHPMCRATPESIRKISPMIIMPIGEVFPEALMLANQITKALGMTGVRGVSFEEHDNIINHGIQGPTHLGAWKFLEHKIKIDSNRTLRDWFLLAAASEKLIFLGFARVFSGSPDLSARIVGKHLGWTQESVQAHAEKWTKILLQADPDESYRHWLSQLSNSSLEALIGKL